MEVTTRRRTRKDGDSLGRKLYRRASTLVLKSDLLKTKKNQGSLEHVRRFYNIFAPVYDHFFPHVKGYTKSMEDLLDRVLQRGNRVLDVGAGTGILSDLIARRGHPCVAFDLHHKMLKRARKKAREHRRKHPSLPILALCEGTALSLPFQDGSFQVVTSSFMLVHLSDEQKRQSLCEMRRVLAPGGRLGLLESRGELTPRYDTASTWEARLEDLGFEGVQILDVHDVYRLILASVPPAQKQVEDQPEPKAA